MRTAMKLASIVLICYACAIPDAMTLALEKDTHAVLNEKIAKTNFNGFLLGEYLKANLNIQEGVQKTYNGVSVWRWIADAGRFEDEPLYTRSFNHFHDPLVLNWNDAGYEGKMSSAVWAQTQSQYLGEYSWVNARDYFYSALTADSAAYWDHNYAETFRAIGQVMHLVQDASVPDHTRNDGHVLYMYEDWVNNLMLKDPAAFDAIAAIPVSMPSSNLTSRTGYNPYASNPISGLFDTDLYNGTNPGITMSGDIGLAEYTNANFLSNDTIFRDYPYPSRYTSVVPVDNYIVDPANPSRQVLRKYFFKTGDGDNGYRLATINYFENYRRAYLPWLGDSFFYDSTVPGTLDNYCYYDYAMRLIPRAVAYSAEIPRYFFRGRVDAVDAKADKDENGDITGMTLKVKNATPGEDMSGGELVVSNSYKMPGAAERSYGHSDEVSLRSDLSPYNDTSGDTYKYEFSFPSSIPKDAEDIQYLLVYRGKLGAEEDAVAGKSFKPKEPLVIDDWEDGQGWTTTHPRSGLSLYELAQGNHSVEVNITPGSAVEQVNPVHTYGHITLMNYLRVGDSAAAAWITGVKDRRITSVPFPFPIYSYTIHIGYSTVFEGTYTCDLYGTNNAPGDWSMFPGTFIASAEGNFGRLVTNTPEYSNAATFPQTALTGYDYYHVVYTLTALSASVYAKTYAWQDYHASYFAQQKLGSQWKVQYPWSTTPLKYNNELWCRVFASIDAPIANRKISKDCTGKDSIKFSVKSTSTTGSILEFNYGIADYGEFTEIITVNATGEWEEKTVDISELTEEQKAGLQYWSFSLGKDAMDIATGNSLENTIYIDNLIAE